MIVYDKEQKQIVIPNGLGNVNIIINQGCDDDKPTPPQDGWGMTGVFNNWGETPDIPFKEDGKWEGRPYKVIRNFGATGGEFKIRRNNSWTNSYTASFHNEPQFAQLLKNDFNMSINDGVWDIYLFFRDDGEPNEMLVLHSGTDLSTIQYEYTLTISTDKENAIIEIADSYRGMTDRYYGSVTVTMKYGCIYYINVYLEGYEDISDEITCYNDEERSYTLTKIEYNTIADIYGSPSDSTVTFKGLVALSFDYKSGKNILFTDHTGSITLKNCQEPLKVGDECLVTATLRRNATAYISNLSNASVEVLSSNNYVVMPTDAVELTNLDDIYTPNEAGYAEMKYLYTDGTVVSAPSSNLMRIETDATKPGNIGLRGNFSDWEGKLAEGDNIRVYMFPEQNTKYFWVTDIIKLGAECGSCNLINPIVFSKEAGNTINAENVQIPAFVYEGNQYYNVDSFNLADIEEFKIHILFKPNNSGDAEPINIFGCEDTDWDNTTFGARIYQGQIYFRMNGNDIAIPYTENTWYDVEMGYNTIKRWVIVNGETLLDNIHTEFNRPSQTLMIGAINSGGNAFRPFYGKIAAIYIKSNANQVWLLPKEDGTMDVYWNNINNKRNSISGENNARFENDSISGDGMKTITWLGNLEDKWVTPSMSERDDNGYIVVSPSEGYNGLKRTVINPQTIYNEGVEAGKADGVNEQKSKLESISITENGTYTKEDGYNHIEVNVADLNGSYDEGYNQGHTEGYNEGKTDGVNEQKGKLTQIRISENGTYTKEDGYSEVVVDVPDLNGDYNEGYAQGKTDGINEQKSKLESISITENGVYSKEDGYNHIEVNVPDLNGSYDEGYKRGELKIGADARVLDVTENGVYKSRFSDVAYSGIVTGVYADGTEFHNYAELSNKIFNTKIAGSVDSRLEFWYKGDGIKNINGNNVIIGSGNNNDKNSFQVRYDLMPNSLRINIGDKSIYITNWNDRVWHHLIISKAEGLWIDGEKKGDFLPTNTIDGEFFINGIGYKKDGKSSANGTFGMIKIDDTIIIPTADGFLNTNTRELLEVVNDGGYNYVGELYRTINVNVPPKINIQKAGLKLGYSTFTEVPNWADFNGITDMSHMFYECSNLQTIPLIDTSNVTDMYAMFDGCSNLQAIPLLNTSNVTNMSAMFMFCNNLQTIPEIDTSNVTNMRFMFSMRSYQANHLSSLPKFNCQKVDNISNYFDSNGMSSLTDVGGWENLKCNWNDNYGLASCPNLTHQSCINILNGLYDFVGNGSTETRTLKVHPNFLTTVGDEISIGVAKGWTITAE